MNAKRDDFARIQEIYDIITETQRQISALPFSRHQFIEPGNDMDDLIAEGIMNRVFRVTEEAGHVDATTASTYGFERSAVNGVRNRLAHAYGEVDREIVWSVRENDFPQLLAACQAFCDDRGLELS